MSDSVKEVLKQLERKEKTTGNSGAVPLTPKAMMLDVSKRQADDPEHRYRWINIKDASNVDRRLNTGYIRVPESEGGAQLGSELALFKVPRHLYENTVQALSDRQKKMENAHVSEMEQVAESVAKMLRDQYGLNIPRERILVQETS